jgi:hypothetical protein
MSKITTYFNSGKLKIYYTEGNNYQKNEFISNLDEHSYIIYQFPWNIEPVLNAHSTRFGDLFENYIYPLNNKFNFKTQFIFCAPTHDTYEQITRQGYSCILLNHNAFLDYNLYNITDSEKIYNAVINSRPFWWKRIYLAKEITNLACILGDDWAKDETSWHEYKEWSHTDIWNKVNLQKVIEIYNHSHCGLILSGNTGDNQQQLKEGANYSSSEYLLCGLPVVTTPNQGGRNYWFDNYNSITCEPTQKSVKHAAMKLVKKLKTGQIKKEKIRADQIDKINKARLEYIKRTQKLFNMYSLNIDASQYFNNNFTNKLGL